MFLFKSYKKRNGLNQRSLWEWFIKSCSQHQINTIKVLVFIFNSCFPFLKKCFNCFFFMYCALHPKIQCKKAVVNKAKCVNMYLQIYCLSKSSIKIMNKLPAKGSSTYYNLLLQHYLMKCLKDSLDSLKCKAVWFPFIIGHNTLILWCARSCRWL